MEAATVELLNDKPVRMRGKNLLVSIPVFKPRTLEYYLFNDRFVTNVNGNLWKDITIIN